MDNEKEVIEEPNTKFEMFNYWKNGFNGFNLFSIRLEKDMFAYVNALQIVLFNIEFRWYLPKSTKESEDASV